MIDKKIQSCVFQCHTMTNRVRRMLQRLKGLVASLDRSDVLELEPDITGTLFGDKSLN